MTERTLTADRGDDGRRLDLVLRRHLRDVGAASRTRIQGWIEDGRVRVNGVPIRRVASRRMAGDLIAVELPAGVLRRPMRAEAGAVCVLHEDDHLLALDKPAGVVVHPTHAHTEGTLMNALLWYARQWPEPQRPSLVGRLDKLTSGVVLVAKSAAMHAALQRALTDAACEKDYLAVVYGLVSPPQGEIRLRLGRDRSDRRKIAASASAGVPCLTRFERLARATLPDAGASLLRCRLVTGRTHQIRVHLSAQGWPIIGDPDYGEPRWSAVADSGVAAALRAFPRQALHAWRLSLVHPVSGARLLIEAPLPEDFRELLALLRLARPSPSCERAVGACENPLARVFQQSTCDSALTG